MQSMKYGQVFVEIHVNMVQNTRCSADTKAGHARVGRHTLLAASFCCLPAACLNLPSVACTWLENTALLPFPSHSSHRRHILLVVFICLFQNSCQLLRNILLMLSICCHVHVVQLYHFHSLPKTKYPDSTQGKRSASKYWKQIHQRKARSSRCRHCIQPIFTHPRLKHISLTFVTC